jgi:hypothetical protein
VALRALALHPVLQLSPGGIKRLVDRPVGRVGPAIVQVRASDEDLMPGKTEVNGDVEPAPMAVMVACWLDDDVAGYDTIEEVLELLAAAIDVGRERAGVRHASKREPKRDLHWETSFLSGKQVSCAQRSLASNDDPSPLAKMAKDVESELKVRRRQAPPPRRGRDGRLGDDARHLGGQANGW